MKITTKDIIKILPFEANFKNKLLTDFDKLNPDQKFHIEQIIWDFYEAIYKLRLEKNLQLALQRAKNEQEKLDEDFYKRVREKTDKEMQDELYKNTTETDLSQIRTKLEALMQQKPN